jgi:hypothetical protein
LRPDTQLLHADGATVSPAEFASFLTYAKDRFGWSEAEVARQLGASHNAPKRWREKGAPKYVALACAALVNGLYPWPPRPRL